MPSSNEQEPTSSIGDQEFHKIVSRKDALQTAVHFAQWELELNSKNYVALHSLAVASKELDSIASDLERFTGQFLLSQLSIDINDIDPDF